MIENTSQRSAQHHVMEAEILGLVGSTDPASDYITGMEAAGQRQLVQSDRIPVDGPDHELLELGFTLGEPDPADPIFRSCTLPEGWGREGTGHSMHSNIVDANGRPRVGIFYKAAFYDRSASFHVKTAASYVSDLLWGEDDDPTPIVDEWTTHELLVEELTKAARVCRERADEQESYYPEGAKSRREQADRADRILARLDASAPAAG
jgi:hypothetical protein